MMQGTGNYSFVEGSSIYLDRENAEPEKGNRQQNDHCRNGKRNKTKKKKKKKTQKKSDPRDLIRKQLSSTRLILCESSPNVPKTKLSRKQKKHNETEWKRIRQRRTRTEACTEFDMDGPMLNAPAIGMALNNTMSDQSLLSNNSKHGHGESTWGSCPASPRCIAQPVSTKSPRSPSYRHKHASAEDMSEMLSILCHSPSIEQIQFSGYQQKHLPSDKRRSAETNSEPPCSAQMEEQSSCSMLVDGDNFSFSAIHFGRSHAPSLVGNRSAAQSGETLESIDLTPPFQKGVRAAARARARRKRRAASSVSGYATGNSTLMQSSFATHLDDETTCDTACSCAVM